MIYLYLSTSNYKSESRHELMKFVLWYCKLNNKMAKYEELSKVTMDLSFLNIFFFFPHQQDFYWT